MIELRAYGIEFPTNLPDDHNVRPKGERGLRINSHYNVQPIGSDWNIQTAWCRPDKTMLVEPNPNVGASSKGYAPRMWVQDGPDPVPGVHVIEGPATIVEGRVPVQLLCSSTAQFGPGNRMVDIRAMTQHDEAVLKAIHRCDLLQSRRDKALEECKAEAAQQRLTEE